MLHRRNALILALAVLTGCATTSTGQSFVGPATPKVGTALLYVFRVPAFAGSLYVARFSLDGERTGSLGNGEYFVRSLTPGRHILKLEKTFLETGREHEIEIHATDSAVHYVQYAVSAGDVVHTGTSVLVLTSDELVPIAPADAIPVMHGLREVK